LKIENKITIPTTTTKKIEGNSNGVKHFVMIKFQKHLVIVKIASFTS